MPGMKEGAGEDPFAETDEDERSTDETTDDPPTGSMAADSGGGQQSLQIPYKLRRDGVQDGRDRVPLFVMPETKRAERNARRDLEDRFDENVSLTDLREALVKVGIEHLDEVEGELEEWGYGMTFDD